LSKPQRRQAAIYVAGLIWIIKFRSIRQTAKQFGRRQTDRLQHLLSYAPVAVQSLQQASQGSLARQAAGSPAVLVLDDTPCPREGKAVEGTGWHHGAKGWVWGWCAVTAMLQVGSTRLFWAVRGYRLRKRCPKGEFRSKIDLAREILTETKACFGPGRLTVLMDCWYAAAELLNLITQAGWTFMCALRSNRTVYVTGKKRRLRHLAKGRRSADFHTLRLSRGRRLRYTGLRVDLPKVGPVQLVLCRIGKQDWHYLVSNDLRLSARQIVVRYLQRSWIEALHREIKQHLGFGELFVRRWAAAQKHWTLLVVAYNLVVLSPGGRRRHSFRAKLEAYQDSLQPEELIRCFEKQAQA
jgi:SRSO17 transposase